MTVIHCSSILRLDQVSCQHHRCHLFEPLLVIMHRHLIVTDSVVGPQTVTSIIRMRANIGVR